jgi:cytochrome P450
VIYTPRYTGSDSQSLSIKGRDYIIPPDTHVIVSQAALHTLPENWGSDSLVWRPDRWLASECQCKLGEEELISPLPGTFLPWIAGPRVCPGKKFAQVEFVAVIASLFRKHRARPVALAGETLEDARNRVRKEVDSSSLKITLSMNHPEKIKLIWEELR